MSGEPIRYAEAAIIALDDAARTQDAFDVGQQLARAQAFATLAGAEQARISNLIAWKALRQSASPSTLPGSGDAITTEIEAALGITDPGAGAVEKDAARARIASARRMLADLIERWEREAASTDGGLVDGLSGCAEDVRAVLEGPLA